MAITQIIHFDAGRFLDTHASGTTVDDAIQKAVTALKGVKTPPQHFVIGTQVQDKGVVQITAEWDAVVPPDSATFETTPEFTSFISTVGNFFGEPQSISHVILNRSAFGKDAPVTTSAVEFVEIYFPTSRVTPEFQKQIDEDFLRFDEILDAKGSVSWGTGWVLEEQDYEDIKGEKAKLFLVARGWESLDNFEQVIKSDGYKEAIPVLLAWNVTWKIWHVERKFLSGFEVVA
ncbi:hypothetical protein AJ80_09870 [Polytolypa hystricis UAMH7299]|uniref:ABM domain-containing protein n=1 Tax=Polytolypa hystricis (strain UAMH7299) TaxID=1447883 RepID=A0A2B7WI27_POLH7|nr:hypothetical protein AJ80_09870 [Polytolypa hystricis UAMH7299]